MTPIDRIVRELFVGRENVLRFEAHIEGQRIDENNVIVLGARCGPEHNSAASLCHELAHMVEIDEARMRLRSWGLRLPEVEVCGTLCVEPTTHQMTDRELRVCAYQAALHGYFGVEEPIEATVRALRFMPDYHRIPCQGGDSRDENRFQWLMQRLREYQETYTLERFFTEFERRFLRSVGSDFEGRASTVHEHRNRPQ